MTDQSALDRKYFIDGSTYNCPFCNRRSVVYSIVDDFSLDWTESKTVYGFLVECDGKNCSKKSLHLSNYPLNSTNFELSFQYVSKGVLKRHEPDADDLDSYFFLHQPTSFFTLDERIPRVIRDLITEADGCRKMNFLVGASGALRKAIYKFLKNKKAHKAKNEKGELLSYKGQVQWLKNKHPLVASEYFDALVNIQGMTSEELHEDKDWKPWSQKEFDFLVATIKAALHEIYVVPEERKGMLARVLKLGPERKKETSKKDK